MKKCMHVYILTNQNRTVLYTGVTSDLAKRLFQHCVSQKGFTAKYRVHYLIYAEEYENPVDAITREKSIKSMSRKEKIILIESINPEWTFLSV